MGSPLSGRCRRKALLKPGPSHHLRFGLPWVPGGDICLDPTAAALPLTAASRINLSAGSRSCGRQRKFSSTGSAALHFFGCRFARRSGPRRNTAGRRSSARHGELFGRGYRIRSLNCSLPDSMAIEVSIENPFGFHRFGPPTRKYELCLPPS
jgi:hypothetical protein